MKLENQNNGMSEFKTNITQSPLKTNITKSPFKNEKTIDASPKLNLNKIDPGPTHITSDFAKAFL